MSEIDPFEEDRLRHEFHEAVKGVVPSADVLDRLREEVEHRKKLKTIGGVTIAGLVVGVALAADAAQQIWP